MELILASTSPRRREILANAGFEFTAEAPGVEENLAGLPPARLVRALAGRKAAAVLARHPDAVVLGADTVVSAGGEILGKPGGRAQAEEMLLRLSDRTHEVYSGVAVLAHGRRVVFSARTEVCFYPLSRQTVRRYVRTGEPYDKAGGYGIQGLGCLLVRGIRGDYFNVMGLPAARAARVLACFGICPRQGFAARLQNG
jgi:septum formation protein